MKKILVSVTTLAFVAVVVAGATGAFFSDTETSTGNTFTAGAIDLTVSGTTTYNGVPQGGLTWALKDLDIVNDQFFDFGDVKPGDKGVTTIGLNVHNNPAWMCAVIEITADDDVTCTEPELKDDTSCNDTDLFNGEMRENLSFVWWPDYNHDGVMDAGAEYNDMFFMSGAKLADILAMSSDPKKLHLTLADSTQNFFESVLPPGDPILGNTLYSVGTAWCMGVMTIDPSGAINCNGESVNNESQTDKMTASLSFTAEQERNQPNFRCEDTYKPYLITE